MAQANLAALYRQQQANFYQLDTKGNGAIFGFKADENYEASILAYPSLLKQNKLPLVGEPVIFVAARDYILVTGSDDAQGLRVAAYIAKKAYSEFGYAISPHGYILKQGQWQRLTP